MLPKRNCYEPGQARNSVLCKWNTLFERTGKPVQRIWFALVRWGFGTLPTLLSILKLRPHDPAPRSPLAAPSALAARHTFRLETEPRPAVRLSGSPPIWTSGSEAPFAVSTPSTHTWTLAPHCGEGGVGELVTLSLSVSLSCPLLTDLPGRG